MRVMRWAALVALSGLAACQSSTTDVLDSAAKGEQPQTVTASTGYKGVTGENPNDPGRLRNTRTALTGYCPRVTVRQGTGVYRVFPNGADRNDISQIKYQATIANTARECAYDGQDLKIRVGVRGRVINGADGATGSFPMPLRVAVVEGGRTVYSKLHKPNAAIADGTSNALFSFVDEDVVIPAPRKANVRVFVGFDEGPPQG